MSGSPTKSPEGLTFALMQTLLDATPLAEETIMRH
jgi:hypothetical protein